MALTPEEQESAKREFAERLLLGDFESALLVLVDEGGNRHFWYEGRFETCAGMASIADAYFKKVALSDG
jgi:hypothetical protein